MQIPDHQKPNSDTYMRLQSSVSYGRDAAVMETTKRILNTQCLLQRYRCNFKCVGISWHILSPEQNDRHDADDSLKSAMLNESMTFDPNSIKIGVFFAVRYSKQ